MEFSSLWYFSFWSVITQIFITIGLNALHKAVDETNFFWSKFFIIYSVCLSCTYAFLFRPSLEQALYLILNVEDFLIELGLRHQVTLLPISIIGIILMIGPSYSIIMYFTCLLLSILPLSVILLSKHSRLRFVLKGMVSPFILYPSYTLCWLVFSLLVCVAPISLKYFDYKTNQVDINLDLDFVLTVVKMFCGCSIVAVVIVSTYLCLRTWFMKKFVSSPILSYIYSRIKLIEIILGIVAYILVQHIIGGKSIPLMWALLSFTIAWVGIVAIVQPPTDFGIFTFLVGASVDCAMSIFGLSSPTWIVGGVCTLLLYLYPKLDSVLLTYSGVRGGILRDWTCLELHKHLQLLVGVTDTAIPGGIDVGEHIWHIQMSPTTSLKIMKGDITSWFVDGATDAIVNPTNERMHGGGNCGGAIHAAAGVELLAECHRLPEVKNKKVRPRVRCPTGEARITSGYKLPVAHVVHTVGPVYNVERNPEVLLRSAYKSCLNIAKEKKINYIAFPAISCGFQGYPIDKAAEVALSTVKKHGNELKEVHFIMFSDDIYEAWLDKALKMLNQHVSLTIHAQP